MIGIVVDTTDRKRADHERLELSGRLIHAQEQERRRLAREIHDDFCQRLAVVTVQMQAMRAMLKDGNATQLVEQVIAAVVGLGADLQALSRQLHSSRFELVGLVPSIAALCADMAKQHQLGIEFDHG
jgi:signal transduction histidine kinase